MKKSVPLPLLLSVILLTAQIAVCGEPNIPAPPQKSGENAVPQDPNYVVMVFDGDELTIGKIKYIVSEPDYDTMENVADVWLNTRLLYEEAVKRGIDKDARVKFLADMEYKKIIAQALIEKIQSSVKITDEDVKKYYAQNKDSDPLLKEPNYFSFSHITVDTIEQAQEVRKRIENGEEINKLAKELSVAGDAKRGGLAGKFREDTIQKRFGQDFLNELLKASEGQIIGPVKNKDGKYEIARHEGKRQARIKEFDKVREQIRATLDNSEKIKAIENVLGNLKDNAKNRYKKMGILSEKEKSEEKEKNQNKNN